MRHTFSFPFFLFILLSPFTLTGNVYALTPVADLTGEWSGFAQVSYDGTPCAVSGKVNGFFEQNGNDLHGEFSFVPTGTSEDICSYEPWDLVVDGTIDGSRITLFDHSGINFSGWYASSGIKLDFAADWGTGTTQLSPTNFAPPAYQQEDEPTQCRADQELVDDQCQCPAGEPEIDGVCQIPEETDGDGDAIPDSEDVCPNDPEDYVGVEDGCPENDQGNEFAEEGEFAEGGDEFAEDEFVEDEVPSLILPMGTLEALEGSVTVTTDDGTPVDSNELKIGQTIQTGDGAGTNVKIEIGNGATVNLKENTQISPVRVTSPDGKVLVIEGALDDFEKTMMDDDLIVTELTRKHPDKYSDLMNKYANFVVDHPIATSVGVISVAFVVGATLPTFAITAATIGTVGYVLIAGAVYFSTPSNAPDGENHSNAIYTPDGIVIHKGTEFTVSVEDGTTNLDVISGDVYFVPYDGSAPLLISSGNSVSASGDNIKEEILNTESVDKWWDTTAKAEPPATTPAPKAGGCLIATAAFGSELAPQIQQLREMRDNVLFSTSSGTAFMSGFNQFYYMFSPTIADWEMQSPVFKEAVKITITPMLWSLSILNHVDIDSEQDLLGYGIGIILLNIGMYFVLPALVILKLKDRPKKNQI
jgi:hypothetical protein